MHKRPTYETLVKDTILEPKDRIALPDRAATILRKTQQLTRYDDAEFLDLEKDNENIAKEKAQQLTVNAAAAAGTGSITQTQATQTGPHLGHTFVSPPVVPEPAARTEASTHSTTSTNTTTNTHSTITKRTCKIIRTNSNCSIDSSLLIIRTSSHGNTTTPWFRSRRSSG